MAAHYVNYYLFISKTVHLNNEFRYKMRSLCGIKIKVITLIKLFSNSHLFGFTLGAKLFVNCRKHVMFLVSVL